MSPAEPGGGSLSEIKPLGDHSPADYGQTGTEPLAR